MVLLVCVAEAVNVRIILVRGNDVLGNTTPLSPDGETNEQSYCGKYEIDNRNFLVSIDPEIMLLWIPASESGGLDLGCHLVPKHVWLNFIFFLSSFMCATVSRPRVDSHSLRGATSTWRRNKGILS